MDYEPWKKNRIGGNPVQQDLPAHHRKEKIPPLCLQNASQLLLTNAKGWMTVQPWCWGSRTGPAHPWGLLWPLGAAAETNTNSSNSMELGRLTDGTVLPGHCWQGRGDTAYSSDHLLSPRNCRSQHRPSPAACSGHQDSWPMCSAPPSSAKQLPWVTF